MRRCLQHVRASASNQPIQILLCPWCLPRLTCDLLSLLRRTGVIHDPVKQTCIFDLDWSTASSGGDRRRLELEQSKPEYTAECAADSSEMQLELGEVKQEVSEAKRQMGEMAAELSQMSDLREELREVKALLKQLAAP